MRISNQPVIFIIGHWTFILFLFLSLIMTPVIALAQLPIAELPPASTSNSSSFPTPPYLSMSNGTYLDIPSNDSLNLTVFTLSAWFNGKPGGQGNGFILSKGATGEGEGPGHNMNYGLYLNNYSQVMGGFETADGLNYILTARSNYTDDKWHHVALTYNGSILSMSVDGKLEAANRTQGALPDTTVNDPLRIGAKSSDYNRGVFTGLADNIIVLNTPLNLPLNFTSTSQIPSSAKIVDIQSRSEIPANITATNTN